MFLGGAVDDLAVSGASVHVNLGTLLAPTPALFSTFTTNAAGFGGWSVGIPNDVALMGFALYAQVAVSDPASTALPELGGIALTRGVRLTFGTP